MYKETSFRLPLYLAKSEGLPLRLAMTLFVTIVHQKVWTSRILPYSHLLCGQGVCTEAEKVAWTIFASTFLSNIFMFQY